MGKNVLTYCGFGLCSFAALCNIIAFSTSNWLESFAEANSRFEKLGLWSACFNNFGYDRDNLGKVYNGCWWIFSYEYRPIWDWLNPKWLLAVQIMMTLVLVLTVVTWLLSLLGIIGMCPPSRGATAQLTNSILMFVAGAFLAISVTIFGIQSDIDRQWIPRPDQNFLSWSFGLAVLAGFFCIFGGMCMLVDSLRLSHERKKGRSPPPYGGYEMKRAPPNY